jgi:hypothetical protein
MHTEISTCNATVRISECGLGCACIAAGRAGSGRTISRLQHPWACLPLTLCALLRVWGLCARFIDHNAREGVDKLPLAWHKLSSRLP